MQTGATGYATGCRSTRDFGRAAHARYGHMFTCRHCPRTVSVYVRRTSCSARRLTMFGIPDVPGPRWRRSMLRRARACCIGPGNPRPIVVPTHRPDTDAQDVDGAMNVPLVQNRAGRCMASVKGSVSSMLAPMPLNTSSGRRGSRTDVVPIQMKKPSAEIVSICKCHPMNKKLRRRIAVSRGCAEP